jgi:hypothetical protein
MRLNKKRLAKLVLGVILGGAAGMGLSYVYAYFGAT